MRHDTIDDQAKHDDFFSLVPNMHTTKRPSTRAY